MTHVISIVGRILLSTSNKKLICFLANKNRLNHNHTKIWQALNDEAMITIVFAFLCLKNFIRQTIFCLSIKSFALDCSPKSVSFTFSHHSPWSFAHQSEWVFGWMGKQDQGLRRTMTDLWPTICLWGERFLFFYLGEQ